MSAITNAARSAVRAFKGAPPTAAELRASLPAREDAVEHATTALAEQKGAYRASLLSEDPAVSRAAATARDGARIDLDRAQERLAQLLRDIDAAERAEAAEARARDRAEAERLRKEAMVIVRKTLPAIIADARAMIGAVANADAAVARFNASCSEDEPRLPHAEAFRDLALVEGRVIAEEHGTAWRYVSSKDWLPDDLAEQVSDFGNGRGKLPGNHDVEKARFVRRTTAERIPAQRAVPLAEAIRLPGLMANDPPGWQGGISGPERVIAELDRLAKLAPADRRPEVTVRMFPADD